MPRCDGDELVDSPPVNQFQSDDTPAGSRWVRAASSGEAGEHRLKRVSGGRVCALLLLFFMASLERSSSPSAIASCSSGGQGGGTGDQRFGGVPDTRIKPGGP
eukprot:scaffold9484_cov124-Isochrysis_galbana.AAC.27